MTGEAAGGPLFIVGFPRSGTTLMRALLSAHPTIAIAPETHFLNRFAKGVEALDLRTAANFQSFWGKFSRSDRFVELGIDADRTKEGIVATGDFHLRNVFALTLQEFARAAGKPRWGEKTPAHDRHIGTLLEWFPDARVIYMVRDPRAACASLLQAPWRTNPGSKSGNAKPGRVRRLRLLNEDSHFWRRSVERYRRDWQHDPRVTAVRYEELASHPEQSLRTVCRFIGAAYDPQMLVNRSADDLPPARAHWGNEEHEQWRHAHIERARQGVSNESVAKWKGQLTPLEVAVVEANCHSRMPALGYEPGADESRARRWRSRLFRGMVSVVLWRENAFVKSLG
ncbi:MAG: sulfotransferase [Gemmatimonadaceae bacterium]|nr:sulfotransferase [Gemmatimonadaceae bacterium]